MNYCTLRTRSGRLTHIAYFKDLRNKAFLLDLVGMQDHVGDRIGRAGAYDLQLMLVLMRAISSLAIANTSLRWTAA